MTMSQFDNSHALSLEEILAQRNSERSGRQPAAARPPRPVRGFGEGERNETMPRLAALDPVAPESIGSVAPELPATSAEHDDENPARSGSSRSRRRRQQRARSAAQRQVAETVSQSMEPEESFVRQAVEFGSEPRRRVSEDERTNRPFASHSDLEGLGIVAAGRESDQLTESLLYLMQEMVYARRQHAEAITEELSWRAEIAKLEAQISRVRTHIEAQSLMSSMRRRPGDYSTLYSERRLADPHHPGARENFG